MVGTGSGRLDAQFIPTVPTLGAVPVDMSLEAAKDGAMSATIIARSLDVRSAVTAIPVGSELTIHATNFWKTNRLLLQAQFGDGMLPKWANISAPAVTVSGTNLLFRGSHEVSTAIEGAWTNGTFEIQFAFTGKSDNTNLPTIREKRSFVGTRTQRQSTN